jgi:hypothetical protein
LRTAIGADAEAANMPGERARAGSALSIARLVPSTASADDQAVTFLRAFSIFMIVGPDAKKVVPS